MKKAGKIVFFVCLGHFLYYLVGTVLLIGIIIGVRSQGAKADEFSLSAPEHSYVNTALEEVLDKETTLKNVRDDSVCARYISPEGIEFTSRSKEWDEADLELLYNELLRNKHGEELNHLSNVIIYPQKDERAAATHKNSNQLCSVPFSHTLLPEGFEVEYFRKGGIITLYNGDGITTVEGMADSLSHEYGHHFTRYYMLDGNGEELYDTEYAKLRGLNAENSYADMFVTEDFYFDNHYKFILEIAAEDYVTLMGSPASREIVDYRDSMENLYTDDDEGQWSSRCSAVQENLTLPMACEMEGLADYFYGFIGEETPEYDIKKEMNIRINRRSQSYNLTTGYKTFVYYEIGFDKVYGEDATYVLSVYDPENYEQTQRFVRTVTSGEKALCYVGNPVRSYGSSVRYIDDGIATGTKVFIVNVITADGKLYTSAPFTYSF